MKTTLNNTADTTLLVLIYNDGKRITREVQIAKTRGAWDKTIKAFGAERHQTAEYISRLVVISETDVTNYSRSEALEVLGL